jgi:hypothetical protein
VHVDPFDSVYDLKQLLEATHGGAWGIDGRKRNREGSLVGWELVQEEGEHEDGTVGMLALSYHLFLHNYGVHDGDVLYAVVRR